MLSFGLDLRTRKLLLRTTGVKPTNTKMTKLCLGFFSEEDGLAASRVPGGRARCLELGHGPGRRQRSGQGTVKPKRRLRSQGSPLIKPRHADFPVPNA